MSCWVPVTAVYFVNSGQEFATMEQLKYALGLAQTVNDVSCPHSSSSMLAADTIATRGASDNAVTARAVKKQVDNSMFSSLRKPLNRADSMRSRS